MLGSKLVVFGGVGVALACSYVEVPVADSAAVNGTKYAIGRTWELGDILNSLEHRAVSTPRGVLGHGYLGIETYVKELPAGAAWIATEGMNEESLTVSAQSLRESVYEGLTDENGGVEAVELVPALLRCCANVDEALDWLSRHRVIGPGGELGFHWALADATGRSVVVEYLRGNRVVHENTPRVMTNDPNLEWQWRNLDTYVNLSPHFPHQNDFLGVKTSVGVVPRAVGHGWNLFGLPGDSSPPSRFAQLFYLRGYATNSAAPKTMEDAIVLASGLLNKVFIPVGTVAGEKSITDNPELTHWAVVKIPAERRMLIRGYRNLHWRQIDISKLDFTTRMTWPVEDGTLGVQDITSSGSGSVV